MGQNCLCCTCCNDDLLACSGPSDSVSQLAFSIGGLHPHSFTENLRGYVPRCETGVVNPNVWCNASTVNLLEWPESEQSLPSNSRTSCCWQSHVVVPSTKGGSTCKTVSHSLDALTSWSGSDSSIGGLCEGVSITSDRSWNGWIHSKRFLSISVMRQIDRITILACPVVVYGVPKYELSLTVGYRVIYRAVDRFACKGKIRMLTTRTPGSCPTPSTYSCCNVTASTCTVSFTQSDPNAYLCDDVTDDVTIDETAAVCPTNQCDSAGGIFVVKLNQTRKIIIDRNCALARTVVLTSANIVGAVTDMDWGVGPTEIGSTNTCFTIPGPTAPGPTTGMNTLENAYEAMLEDWTVVLS